MRRLLLALLIAFLWIGLQPAGLTLSQGPTLSQVQVTGIEHEYLFGSQASFRARVASDVPVAKASLFLQIQGESSTRKSEVLIGPEGELSHRIDLSQQPFRAFSTISYWYELALQDGESYSSEKTEFLYEDNRFAWQTRDAQPFRLHWYDGDADYAQSILDIARVGLQHIQSLLPLHTPDRIDIYAYSTAAEMQTTLSQTGHDWVSAGHADPDLGIMVVTLPLGPEQRLLMEQRIPHELMHILLFQATGPAYPNLPTWLNEGLASVSELYPNPDYLVLLDSAQKKGQLLPISSLCQTFPRDASNALLAYAQSATFTRYLQQQFGTSGLQALLAQYQDGVACERGVEVALGSTLAELEREWRRATFGENYLLTAAKKLLPWMVLLAVVLAVPIGLGITGMRRNHPVQGPH